MIYFKILVEKSCSLKSNKPYLNKQYFLVALCVQNDKLIALQDKTKLTKIKGSKAEIKKCENWIETLFLRIPGTRCTGRVEEASNQIRPFLDQIQLDFV